jgi:hypothetical protein
MSEKVTQNNVLKLWANQYPDVVRWLTHLQKKEQSAIALHNFCMWANKEPTELLALKGTANTVEKLLDDFVASTAFTNIQTFQGSIAVKSFFKWNYADLAKACGAVSYEKVKPYNKLTKEGLRKLWTFALNPRDKALITFINSTAIAKETLTNLKWMHLEEGWETIDLPCINIPSELLKGHGKGRYKGVRQTTFLTPEAKRDLMNYKEWIERPQKLGRKLTLNDHMWLETGKPYQPIVYGTFGSLIFTLSRNTGVPFSWHDARRWVNTALEQIGISPNWARKIRGRKVKGEEAPYSQPAIEQLRAKFREAVPLLEFTTQTSGLEERMLKQEFLTELNRKDAAGEPLTVQDNENIKRFGIHRIFMRKVPSIPDEKCVDGEHCGEEFKDIEEDALLDYLQQGWALIHTLQNGRVIIKR